jgi:hypothetical protein
VFHGKDVSGVTISLDGFAEDDSNSVGALYPDLKELDNSEVMAESQRNTGAVVMPWKEYAMAPNPRRPPKPPLLSPAPPAPPPRLSPASKNACGILLKLLLP